MMVVSASVDRLKNSAKPHSEAVSFFGLGELQFQVRGYCVSAIADFVGWVEAASQTLLRNYLTDEVPSDLRYFMSQIRWLAFPHFDSLILNFSPRME